MCECENKTRWRLEPRNERQKEVVEAIIRKAGSLSSITKYGEVLDGLDDNLSTNLTFQNICFTSLCKVDLQHRIIKIIR